MCRGLFFCRKAVKAVDFGQYWEDEPKEAAEVKITMIKLLGLLSKMLMIAVLVAGVTVYVAWTTIHLYVDKLLAQFPFADSVKKLGFSDLLDEMTKDWKAKPVAEGKTSATGKEGLGEAGGTNGSSGTGGALQANAGVSPGTTAGPNAGSGTQQPGMGTGTGTGTGGSQSTTNGSSGDGSGGANGGSTGGTSGSGLEHVPDNALPVFGQSGISGGDAQQKSILMTAEQFAMKKDLLSDEDKMRIFTLLTTRLPETDVQKYAQKLENGFTNDDLGDLDRSLQKYLKPGEYEELMGILKKY